MTEELLLNDLSSSNFDEHALSTIVKTEANQSTHFSKSFSDFFEDRFEKIESKDVDLIDSGMEAEPCETVENANDDLKQKYELERQKVEAIEASFLTKYKSFSGVDCYSDKREFNGVVDSVDRDNRSFVATFFDIMKKEEMIKTFSFDDLSYEDDVNRIAEGTGFVLVVGKKRKCFNDTGKLTYSGKENFCRIYLRHPRKLNPMEEEMVDEEVGRWAKLFNR